MCVIPGKSSPGWKLTRRIRASSSLHSHVLFITLTCYLPEWCDKTKLSNLLLPRKGGTIQSLRLLSAEPCLMAPTRHIKGAKHSHALVFPKPSTVFRRLRKHCRWLGNLSYPWKPHVGNPFVDYSRNSFVVRPLCGGEKQVGAVGEWPTLFDHRIISPSAFHISAPRSFHTT